MTQTMLQRVLATAEKVDGAEAWIHLCLTAAEEAREAVKPPVSLSDEDRHELRVMLGKVEKEFGSVNPQALTMRERIALEQALGEDQRASEEDARAAEAAAFRANLPPITNRRSVQAFVACVAAGVSRQYIAVRDANALLYTAQTALSAFPKRNARKGGK